MAQLILKEASKFYLIDGQRIDAVRPATFTIEQGEFVSIVGHSGSGKTTLLSMIGGITPPSSGVLLFDQHDLSTLSSDQLAEYRSGRVGFMFQFASLLPSLTIRENLMLPTLFSEGGTDGAESSAEKAVELLSMVGLSEKINVYPGQLSGGQQRRVAIARAFMNNPSLILADEPTGDLDEETEQDMMNLFSLMNKQKEITFVMVTHNSDLAERTDRRFRMSQGSINEL